MVEVAANPLTALTRGAGLTAQEIETQEHAIVSELMDRYHDAERSDRPFKLRAMLHWEHINNVLPDDWPYFSRFFEPETQAACWDTIQGIMGAVFQKDEYFDLHAVEEQDEVQVEMMRELGRFVLREKEKYKLTKFYQCQEAVFFGNGVQHHFIEPRVRTTRSRRPLYVNDPAHPVTVGMTEVVTQELEVWPVSSILSRFDCYPAPSGASIHEMPFFFHRMIVPVRWVQAKGKLANYRNTEKIEGHFYLDQQDGEAAGQWHEENFDLPERLAAVGYDVRDGSLAEAGPKSVKYCELLFYTESPADGPGCDRVAIIADRKLLLRGLPGEDKNPFAHGRKPYSEIKYSPRDPTIWQAKGVAELIESSQVKINTRQAQVGDIIEEIRSPMTYVGAAAGVEDLSDLESWPNAKIPVNDPHAIVDRRPPGVPNDIWNDIMQTRASIQRSPGGSPDYSRGVAGSGTGLSRSTETATGLSLLLNASSQAKSFRWLLAEETGIKDGLNMTMSLVQQFMTVPQKIRILGSNRVLQKAGWSDFVVITPEDIAGNYDFYPVGAAQANDNAVKAEVALKVFQHWAMLPKVYSRFKQQEAAVEVAELLGLKNPRRFLMSDAEYQQMIQEEGDPAENALRQDMMQKLVESLDYRDAPPDVKQQIEQLAGLQPSQLYGLQMLLQAAAQQQKAKPPLPAAMGR